MPDNQVDALLETTISRHGYLLINHKYDIEELLVSALRIYGLKEAAKLLDLNNGGLINKIYKTINTARSN